MARSWIAAAFLAGCVPSQSSVFEPVDREIQRRIGVTVEWTESTQTSAAATALLEQPLDLDTAVRIALARNRRLQARFDELGIAASQIADATVLPPITVDADYKHAVSGGGTEIELTAVQDVLDLAQLGQRRGIARSELRGAQARAIAATIELAAHVELAFYAGIAAQQELELVRAAFATADASADLVERQHAAGNTSDLALAHEQEQRERARIEIGRAQQQLQQERTRLAALLGLADSETHWSLAGRLAEPLGAMPPLDDLAATSNAASLDLSALRADADAAASRHSYAIVRTLLPELGVGISAARRDGANWEVGPAVRIGIPLFNQQQGPRARALAESRRARDEQAATTTELRASVEMTRSRVQQAFAEVHQLVDVVMPLRKRVLDETVLQYDAMNASTFELLIARRDMVDIQRQYIEALRRYWSAMAEVKALRRGCRVMSGKDVTP